MEDETREVLRETKRTLISVRRVMWVMIGAFATLAGAATYTGHRVHLEVRQQCAASGIGLEIGKLNKFVELEDGENKGIWRRTREMVQTPISKEMAERQREAVARIILKNVADGKISLCPDVSITEKLKIGINRWKGKWQSEQKYVEGDAYARAALAGQYKHPWPAEWACVNNYQAKWGFAKKPVGTPIADLGGMKLYCQTGEEKKCWSWNPWCKD